MAATRTFERIGLAGRPGHGGVADTLRRLLDFFAARGLTATLDETTAALVGGSGGAACRSEELAARSDLVIVVGGDGSMLNMAKHVVSSGVPVIGVNRGRLGFLTDVLPEELEARFAEVLDGRYAIEERFLLDAVARREGGEEPLGLALNDVVLHPGKAAQMIEFELFVDDSFVYSQESDGLIVATPTGSTAYALSAGGPIMHPGLDAVVLAPMYPHSLTSRPIVVDGDSRIRLVVGAKGTLRPQLSCDGKVRYTARAGDEFVVSKNPVPLRLIHPADHSFYQACRGKLGWGSRLARNDG